jgi:cellulose synthase/poly-beta-1,6-N-acetylglucosamine synthase-like glycosyltransferase
MSSSEPVVQLRKNPRRQDRGHPSALTGAVQASPASDRNPIPRSAPTASCVTGLDVVILARDEADVIGETLRSLVPEVGNSDRIHVVADHCHDQTPRLAREAGAAVHVRSGAGPEGKGAALRWWLERTGRQASARPWIVVLDADTRVAPGFFARIRQGLGSGAAAIQARLEPDLGSRSLVPLLAAYSETVELHVYDALRSALKWPVRLRGTGMAFQRPILERASKNLHTAVEDVELSLLLTAAGETIQYAPDTYVTDPKPRDQAGAIRQRARWLKGQLEIVRDYRGVILRLLAQGPPGWSLLSSTLAKPRTIVLGLKGAVAIAGWLAALWWGGMAWRWLAAIGTLSLGLEVAAYGVGLRFVESPREIAGALVRSPVYAVLWLKSVALSLVPCDGWLRSRSAPAKDSSPEAASAD